MQLDGKVAIVTGANQGIGREIAVAYTKEGAKVVMVARRKQELDTAAEEIRSQGGEVTAIAADVSKEASAPQIVEGALSRYGTLDILVNNAGIAGPQASIEDVDLAGWQECLDVNITGPWLLCRHAVKVMKEKKSGNIINIGSISGKRPLKGRTAYCSSKMALLGLTRALALELAESNINVNIISPGAVNSPRLALLAEGSGMPLEKMLTLAAESSPLKRISEPHHVASLCVYLACDAAQNITGQDINVDAGTFMD